MKRLRGELMRFYVQNLKTLSFAEGKHEDADEG